MDYDQTTMPSAYDAGRGYSRAVLEFWLRTIAAPLAGEHISDILDLGCGTGRYTAALAAHFGAAAVGVDPSENMLAEARRKGGRNVTFLRGSGEATPLADAWVDMVFMSMVFHHFHSPLKAAQECRRVLRSGGVACLRAGATDRIDSYPYVPFFPDTRPLLRKDLQSLAFIESTFEGAGFRRDHHEVVLSEVAANWTEYSDKLAHRADSILIQLADHRFGAGLAALRDHARQASKNERVIEPVDFFVFRAPR
ncbi:MAG TPA: class I SAM-dependent methyltransferase [Caulobacteraceae bacterium]|nr:class I SAM-dependent methyltransferase [Caulobacteraceae bacterium]